MAYLNMSLQVALDNFEEACLFGRENTPSTGLLRKKKFQRTVNLQRRLKGGMLMTLTNELKAVLDSIPSGMCFYSVEQGRLYPLYHNPAFLRCWGIPIHISLRLKSR